MLKINATLGVCVLLQAVAAQRVLWNKTGVVSGYSLDKDGRDDFLVACDAPQARGAVCVHSGRTGTSGNVNGYAFADIPMPLAVGPRLFRLHGQWLVLGAGAKAPGGLSGALSWPH